MWTTLPPPRPNLRCVVVLPVRNEAAHIGAALSALHAQKDLVGRPFDRASFEVLVLANNCDDDSAALARRFAREHADLRLHVTEVALAPDQANIGFVRRCLMDEACRRLELAGCGERAIASTDGDTRVAEDWLAWTLQELRRGADAVGGRILTDAAEIPSPEALRIRRLDAAHSLLRSRLASLIDPDRIDPWPRHHQHFGASLAVTAEAYRRAGGVPDVPFLEDEALVRALCRTDLRVRHSPVVRVTTSSRLDGRAAVGLSWQLRQWAHDPAEHGGRHVESAPRFARALVARRALRKSWEHSRRRHGDARPDVPQGVAEQLGLDAEQVGESLAGATHFGAAWETIERLRHDAAQPGDWVPLSEAMVGLRRLVSARLNALPQAEAKASSRYCA